MMFNVSFEAVANCIVYDTSREDGTPISVNTEIKLEIFKSDAENILYRFSPGQFSINDYKVIMKTDTFGNLKAITLIKDTFEKQYLYVVNNTNTFLSNIHQGYIRILLMEKVSDIMEYDFETSLQDRDGIIDEFDLEDNED